MADLKAIAEELVNLTVKEVSELKAILKDEYGIEPAAAAVAVAAAPGAGAEAAAEEKTSFPCKTFCESGDNGWANHFLDHVLHPCCESPDPWRDRYG